MIVPNKFNNILVNMKTTLFLLLASALTIFSSCQGGWSEDQKTALKNNCIGSGNYDCDCYVEKITTSHEGEETYNALSQAEKEELVQSCYQESEEEEEEIESF